MKRIAIVFLITIAVLVVLSLGQTVPASKCVADPCGRENQVDCINQALQNLQGCIGSATYCADQFDQDYNGCMVLKGCASPPPPIM